MNSRTSIEEVFSRGYDAGNYANAYVSANLKRAWDKTLKEMESDTRKLRHVDPKAFRAGFVLGFFSSYEDHEVSHQYLDELHEANRKHPGHREESE